MLIIGYRYGLCKLEVSGTALLCTLTTLVKPKTPENQMKKYRGYDARRKRKKT